MKGYIYCNNCGRKLILLDEVEYCNYKEQSVLPYLYNVCITKKVGLENVFDSFDPPI